MRTPWSNRGANFGAPHSHLYSVRRRKSELLTIAASMSSCKSRDHFEEHTTAVLMYIGRSFVWYDEAPDIRQTYRI